MMMTDAPKNIRFGLFVFVFLIIFCLVQLTWWIIYQLDLNRQLYQQRIGLLELKTEAIVNRVNNDFRRLSDLAGYAISSAAGNQSKIEQCLNNLLLDEAVIGYQMLSEDGKVIFIGGELDSTFYFEVREGLTLHFDSGYPQRLIGDAPPNLIFTASGLKNGAKMAWVQAEMFEMSPFTMEQIENESQKGLKMFIFEGGFFMLVVLFGAYLIYRTLQRSEELKARQVNFIHSVTHEFRTPLTSVRLYLETLQSGLIDKSQAEDLYGKMIDDCDRLDGMVDNVLETGYMGRENYKVNLSVTDLTNDLDEYMIDLKSHISRQKGILVTDLQENVKVRSDYHSLGRAIRAIIDNSLKYSPPDRRIITVTLERIGKNAVITISDKGLGISAYDRKKIFDRFYRGRDNKQAAKGTGLGLYLVRQIIKAHGGTIDVDSKGPDPGSCFVIKLPAVEK
jgi:hypothetical protein